MNLLTTRLFRAVSLRDRIRESRTDTGTINFDLADYSNRPWADFFTDQTAVEALLFELCPGWVYLGAYPVLGYYCAAIGNRETGKSRETNRISDPPCLSLLTLVLETHVEILTDLISRIENGDKEEVKKVIDNSYISSHSKVTDEHFI